MRMLVIMGKDAAVATCVAFIIAIMLATLSPFSDAIIAGTLCLFLVWTWGYYLLVWYRIHKGNFGSNEFEKDEIKIFEKKEE